MASANKSTEDRRNRRDETVSTCEVGREEVSEVELPARVEEALDELDDAAKEGLLALVSGSVSGSGCCTRSWKRRLRGCGPEGQA